MWEGSSLGVSQPPNPQAEVATAVPPAGARGPLTPGQDSGPTSPELGAGGRRWGPSGGPAPDVGPPLPSSPASAPPASGTEAPGQAEGAGQARTGRGRGRPPGPAAQAGREEGDQRAGGIGRGASTHQWPSLGCGGGRTSSPSAIAVDVHVTLPESGPGAERNGDPVS